MQKDIDDRKTMNLRACHCPPARDELTESWPPHGYVWGVGKNDRAWRQKGVHHEVVCQGMKWHITDGLTCSTWGSLAKEILAME